MATRFAALLFARSLSHSRSKIGCKPQTLLGWVRQHEKDTGQRDGATTAEHEPAMSFCKAAQRSHFKNFH